MKRSTHILMILYLASALMPMTHTLLHAFTESCEVCLAATTDGPSLSEGCDGPCSDPDHHHHPSHNQDDCSICQRSHASHAITSISTATVLISEEGKLSPESTSLSWCTADVRISAARAPPLVSAL